MIMKRKLYLAAALACICALAGGQSHKFKLGKWTEIQTAILKELDRSYVDSLPVDKIERKAVDAMLSELDPYTVYIPEEENENLQMMIHKSYGGIGAVIYKPELQGNVIINEPYEGSPAHKNGLQCGDEIVSIDSQSVKGLSSQQSSDKMRGEPGTKVVFGVKKLRSADTLRVEIVREKIHFPDIDYSAIIGDKIGYIVQSGFTDGVAKEMRQTVIGLKKAGAKTIVLDLRGNGGGLMNEAVDIVSIFVPKGSLVVSARGRTEKSWELRTQIEPVDTKIPLIVLVDSGSASASEIVAGALQDMDRATIMGERTFGKGLVQSIRSLPYGGELKLTTSKYYTPSGRCVQAIDYSRRREDGSVGSIPDSLTREFKTAHGRIVRDGGGITPDVEIKEQDYSRITYALAAYGVLEQFALEYVRRHESIAPAASFKLEDDEFEAFVEYAKGKEFDYRSSAKAYFDRMKEELSKDGLSESAAESLTALEKALEIEKSDFIRLKKAEIVPLIEQEIVVRYYFQKARFEVRVRYDEVLEKALKSERITVQQ